MKKIYPLLLVWFWLGAWGAAAGPAEAGKALDCARCHQNSALRLSLKNETGVPRSLYIPPEAFRESWHYKLGGKTRCVMCHQSIKSYPHEREERLRCSDCHSPEKKPEFLEIGQALKRSVHRELECNDCHDVHRNKPAAAMTLEDKNEGCLKCHAYGLASASPHAARIPLWKYHTWHPQARLHLALMACIVCHTDLETSAARFSAAGKHLVLPRDEATRECSVCHRAGGKAARYLIDIGPESKSGKSPAELLKRIYLVGWTREPLVERGGLLLVLLTFAGVAAHGGGRVYLRLRRKS